ncbi:MAG TPA: hypothetical protein VI636_18590 [Candidatus Angelobacter sp.]
MAEQNPVADIRRTIDSFVKEVMENRAKVIDDFCMTYLAARTDFFKQDPKRLTRLELCIKKNADGLGETMWFQIRPGKQKNSTRGGFRSAF